VGEGKGPPIRDGRQEKDKQHARKKEKGRGGGRADVLDVPSSFSGVEGTNVVMLPSKKDEVDANTKLEITVSLSQRWKSRRLAVFLKRNFLSKEGERSFSWPDC